MGRPMIGITSDVVTVEGRERIAMYPSYARAVAACGGIPVLLTHEVGVVRDLVDRLDGFVLTGGDDPAMEEFGDVTDHRVTRLHPDRQRFEVSLLRELEARANEKPVLGVCLGMQMMALVAGGKLDQYLPDSCPTAAMHWEQEHEIVPSGAGWLRGRVLSRHKQAVRDVGRLSVLASAPDGIVEAVGDPRRKFFVGVQWHPERTSDDAVGAQIFRALVQACDEVMSK